MAAPGLDKTKVFVSLGTSFIFGARVKAPVVNRESFYDRFKNMRGVGGTYSLCKDFRDSGYWSAAWSSGGNRCLGWIMRQLRGSRKGKRQPDFY